MLEVVCYSDCDMHDGYCEVCAENEEHWGYGDES